MARNSAFVRGHAGPVIWDGSELGISIAYDRRAPFTLKADCLINAVGFDTWSLLEMVKAGGVKGVLRPGESELREKLAEAMASDLSFPEDAGLGARLHVPSLRASRSEAHNSELQSLIPISYDVFCLKKKQKVH